MKKIMVSILPNQFLKENGTFNLEEAMKLSGQIAGVCYDQEGFSHIQNESIEKTQKRIDTTTTYGHYSVYDHISVSLNIENIPKILAMVLNNENQYTTSEKSARYTPIIQEDDSVITDQEAILYNKWIEIFKIKITSQYGNIYNESKIQKLAQENARYLVTVFMPTKMIYTTTLRQINNIAIWMENYINTINLDDHFSVKLAKSMQELIIELKNKNLLDERLMKNDKNRKISLFGDNINNIEEYFGFVYITKYSGSLAQFAQAQRHRTLNYALERTTDKQYYIPPIIADDQILVQEWLNDMKQVTSVTPQGEIVNISESGTYDKFILKCLERLCGSAQKEIRDQTLASLRKYAQALKESNSTLYPEIEEYTHGARCTFPDYKCPSDCKNKEAKILTLKI